MKRNRIFIMYVALALGTGISAVYAEQIEADQVKLIRETAESICNTIRDQKGTKTVVEVQGDVKAQLVGLAGKISDAGVTGKTSIKDDEFEGLSQEALATALQGERECRERLFDKMYDRPPSAGRTTRPPVQPLPVQTRTEQVATGNTKSSAKPAQHIAKLDCRSPPQHYFCDGSGCLHRTPQGVLLGLPQLSQRCPH